MMVDMDNRWTAGHIFYYRCLSMINLTRETNVQKIRFPLLTFPVIPWILDLFHIQCVPEKLCFPQIYPVVSSSSPSADFKRSAKLLLQSALLQILKMVSKDVVLTLKNPNG